jgi:hypothetical protein
LHLGGPERLSRYDIGLRAARLAGANGETISATSRQTAPGEPRLRDTSLVSTAAVRLLARSIPGFDAQIEEMLGRASAR